MSPAMASPAPVSGAGLLHKLDAFNNCVLGCVLVPGRDVVITISAPRWLSCSLHSSKQCRKSIGSTTGFHNHGEGPY